MTHLRILIGTGFFLSLFTSAFSQEVGISNSTLTACEGFLVDSGLSASDYSNNENFTMTICAEAPETVINLYFNLFDLGAGDSMTIYDGDNTGAPLIGTYTGGEIQATDITSSETNSSGCLTIVWVTDASDVGNFTAEISCGPPCIRPIAAVDIAGEIPWKICPGEEISLDASPTEFADGASLGTFTWNFDDGNTNSFDWPVVTHSFEEPGDYTIQLQVIDDVECQNNNLIDVLVLVATEPVFDTSTTDLNLCLGQEVPLTGVVTPVTWTGIPNADFGGALFIPDDQTQCFSSELTLGSFTPGQTIEDENDIESFFINFEHSFMGDLTISFICPNGQSIAVHQQGGGGTYLGEPIDDGSEVPGVGYDYWWSPDATNGTWEEESGGTLPSGTYSSVQPWSNLIGCPLNGTWTIEICDSWAIDNGFIFDWAVQFAPELYPEIITFTPSFGDDCDSTFWEGPFITDNGANCSDVMIMPTETGTFDYNFVATNDHGCVYTHPISVEVSEVFVDAGEDIIICAENPTIDATASIDDPFFTTWTYEWTPEDNLDFPWVEDPTVIDLGQTTTYTLTAYPFGLPECAASDDVQVILQEADPLVISGPDGFSPCPGDEVEIGVTVTGGNGGNTFSWDPGSGDDSSISVTPDETTIYTVTVVDACGLTETYEIEVEVANPGTVISGDSLLVCAGGTTFITGVSGGNGDYTYFLGEGISWQSTFNLEIYVDEPGFYEIEIEDDCQASGTIDVVAIQCEIFIPNVFTPDGNITEGDNDYFVVDGLEFFPGSKLTIFNRWGNVVLEDEDYKNNWSPDDISEGTYYYILEVAMPDNTVDRHSGHLTILNKE